MSTRLTIPVALTLSCNTGQHTICFTGACPVGGSFPVNMTPLSVVVTCGGVTIPHTGTGFCITFHLICGLGPYTITYTSPFPWADGVIIYSPTTACVNDVAKVTVPLRDGLVCCPCGPTVTPLFLTDDFGTWPIDMGGDAASSGTRDHTLDTTTGPVGQGRVNCVPPICFCPDCTEYYIPWNNQTLIPGTGVARVDYSLTCGVDDIGPYYDLTARWVAGAALTYDFQLSGCWCKQTTVAYLRNCGNPAWCDLPIDHTLTCTLDAYGHCSSLHQDCTGLDDSTAIYHLSYGASVGGDPRFGFSRARNHVSSCDGTSFAQSFTLTPGIQPPCTSAPAWVYETPPFTCPWYLPAGCFTAWDNCAYFPPPPGGTTITVTS